MKNRKYIISISVLAIFMLVFILTGCGPQELEYEQVSYADEMTENMLLGQNELDYDKYSRDFTQDMLSAVTEANFEEQIGLLEEADFSPYVEDSKEFLSAVPDNGYISVYYKIEVLQERVIEGETKSVKAAYRLKMVFEEVGREMKIAGYWYE